MTTIKPSNFATFEHGDWSGPLEHGIVFDHSHDSTRSLVVRVLTFTRELSEKMGRALDGLAIVDPCDEDDENSGQDESECLDECMNLLGSLAPEGWRFDISDNSLFFLRHYEDAYCFEITRQGESSFFNYDGETFTPDHGYVWEIEVQTMDEDGDATETVGTFAATWAGGRACYVNVFGYMGDAEEVASNVSGSYVGNACEVLHIGDPEEERSEQMADARIAAWLQDYADGVSYEHDASHMGLPS